MLSICTWMWTDPLGYVKYTSFKLLKKSFYSFFNSCHIQSTTFIALLYMIWFLYSLYSFYAVPRFFRRLLHNLISSPMFYLLFIVIVSFHLTQKGSEGTSSCTHPFGYSPSPQLVYPQCPISNFLIFNK